MKIKKNSKREWGALLLIVSVAFGMIYFFITLSQGSANLGDIDLSIAFFGTAVLWSIVGLSLLIIGTMERSRETNEAK